MTLVSHDSGDKNVFQKYVGRVQPFGIKARHRINGNQVTRPTDILWVFVTLPHVPGHGPLVHSEIRTIVAVGPYYWNTP